MAGSGSSSFAVGVRDPRFAVDGERDVTEDRQVEAGGGDDDAGGDLLTGADLYPMLGERLNGVGDDRGRPLAQGREQITVRDDGDAPLPRAVAGGEVLFDVEALRQQRADGLDEERVQLVRRFQRRPGQPVVLRDVLGGAGSRGSTPREYPGRAASRRARLPWAERSNKTSPSGSPPCPSAAGSTRCGSPSSGPVKPRLCSIVLRAGRGLAWRAG